MHFSEAERQMMIGKIVVFGLKVKDGKLTEIKGRVTGWNSGDVILGGGEDVENPLQAPDETAPAWRTIRRLKSGETATVSLADVDGSSWRGL